tara:strand:+ start:43 stop:222 length:180 start_codon:yes stop_codon:yes gene_type:complete
MIKDKKLKVKKTPSRRKFFKAAAATGVAAVAASSLAAPAVALKELKHQWLLLGEETFQV